MLSLRVPLIGALPRAGVRPLGLDSGVGLFEIAAQNRVANSI